MELTERFGLIKQSQDDFYDVDNLNANVNAIETQAMKGIGVLNCRVLSAEEYESLEKRDTQTLYLVIKSNSFNMYLGEIPLEGGTAPANATRCFSGVLLGSEIGVATYTKIPEREV